MEKDFQYVFEPSETGLMTYFVCADSRERAEIKINAYDKSRNVSDGYSYQKNRQKYSIKLLGGGVYGSENC